MKKIILSLALVASFTTINAQSATKIEAPQKEVTTNVTIDFESKVYDYGVIEHNGNGDGEFVFTNNGTEPLLIKNAKGSCGCTVPSYPKEEILPGDT